MKRAIWTAIVLISGCLLAGPGIAKGTMDSAGYAYSDDEPDVRAGVTVDLLPVVTSLSAGRGGGSVQLWAGRDHQKLRVVAAHLALPDGLVNAKRFGDKRMTVIAALIDYTFGENSDGFWIGGGAEMWWNRIDHQPTATEFTWRESVATAGLGYIWFVGDLEINPWAAVHRSLNPPTVGLVVDRYQPDEWTAEVSLKLGWRFR